MNLDVRHPAGMAGERDPRPVVAVPRRGVPGAVIAALGLLAALLLFVMLDAQRRSSRLASEADDPATVPYAPPPPLSIPAEGVVQPQYVPVVPVRTYVPAPVVVAAPVAAPPPERVRERVEEPPRMPPMIYREPPPERPLPVQRSRAASGEPALVIDTGGEMPMGTLIPAVLETPIDTSKPGSARAIVSQDARGIDGRRVLVPRGSRLIGEYQSDVRPGQNRVLVNWTRLVRPDGSTVRLGLPSSDALGGAGIPGQVHSFFIQRFLSSALQTAFSLGGNLAGGRAGNTIIVGLPAGINAASGQAGQGLISNEGRRPKITVPAGTLFNVFVAREIDFSGNSSER